MRHAGAGSRGVPLDRFSMHSNALLDRSMTPKPAAEQAAATSPGVGVPVEAKESSPKHSYGQILKSSALIGGSSILSIGVNIVRAKALALMLGPAGVGLLGLFSSVLEVAQSIAGMGINNSGVRQIAEATGSGDTTRIARTATVLRRTSIGLGIAGALVLLVCCRQISAW